ncbi:MAG: hypothetical protein AAF741_08270 [Bacteroidota bacterium]
MNKLMILIILLVSSCKTTDIESTIQIRNNSDQSISTFIALPIEVGFAYPDTILPLNELPMQSAVLGQQNFYDFSTSLEDVLSELPNDTLSIFYFSTDTLNKYSWEEIRDNYMILRRDDLVPPADAVLDNYWLIEYP